MTKPKSKSKMIKALLKWGYVVRTDGFLGVIINSLKCKSKSEITKLFNKAITNKQKGNYNV